ncbi:hypothetical protein [Halomarina pelagica]|uniref:hypothetical protein n=1 Tax=Halomarina pelagica TaxID=2961599 RepID=UPI0020C5A86C|nr:hypothetical protein [Halomarina sp. BND7]
MGLLGRGWSPTKRQRLGLRLALAVLLIVNPVYIGALNLDLSGYRYSVEPVSIEDGRITVANEGLPDSPFTYIDCSGWQISTGCAYERSRVQAGQLQLNATYPNIRGDAQFAYHPVDGQPTYYQRGADRTGGNSTITLEPVDAQTVLDSVAVSESRLSLRLRAALLVGGLRTDEPLSEANRIIATGDSYVAFSETERRSVSSGESVETGLSVLGVLLGTVLLRTVYRRLPE